MSLGTKWKRRFNGQHSQRVKTLHILLQRLFGEFISGSVWVYREMENPEVLGRRPPDSRDHMIQVLDVKVSLWQSKLFATVSLPFTYFLYSIYYPLVPVCLFSPTHMLSVDIISSKDSHVFSAFNNFNFFAKWHPSSGLWNSLGGHHKALTVGLFTVCN